MSWDSSETSTIPSPLYAKIQTVTTKAGTIGLVIALLYFTGSILLFFIDGLNYRNDFVDDENDNFIQNCSNWNEYLIVTFTLIMVSIPGGIKLALVLSVAFICTKMARDNILVKF